MPDNTTLPADIAHDVTRAVDILKDGGCTAVFLFGSAAQGSLTADSDLDIAVEGCPREAFFHLYGRLYMELDRLVDLVDLDTSDDPFVDSLKARGGLRRVG